MAPGVAVYEKPFQAEPVLPPQLVSGCKALKYEEGDANAMQCTVGVDNNCFFFYWMDQHRKSYCVDLATLRDTRIGEKRSRLPRDTKILQLIWSFSAAGGERDIGLEEKCMTVVCGSSYTDLRFINFIFSRRSDAYLWTKTLFHLSYNVRTQNLSLERTLLKIYTGIKLSSTPEVRISVKDIIQYFYSDKDDRRRCEKALESHKNDPILLEKFQFKDFLRLFSQIVPRPDLEDEFRAVTSGDKIMTLDQVRDFLNRTQRDPRLNEILHPYATVDTARSVVDKYEPHESFKSAGHLSQDGFMRLLISDANVVISPASYTLHQDLSQPLSHYFINSSHNTYLLGAQIKGRSTSEMYRQALLAGCRCVELDIWDGEDGEPIVTHGHTLTVPIGIQEVLLAISDYAFKTTDLPLVLSLENHCSAKVQDKLARYFKRSFGPNLLDKPLASHPLSSGVLLPSVEMLRNRIIIKNKKKAPAVASVVNQPIRPFVDGVIPDEPLAENSDTDEEGDDPVPENDLPAENGTTAAPLPDVVQMVETELSALVNYVQPTKFDSFEAARKRNRSYECVSYAEDRAMVILKKDPVLFIDFNKRQLSRIYPAPTRVKSTNFLPFFFWSAGCQMVALNFQTPDLGMQLNTAMFEYNGRCGYLLKPELMRRKDRSLDPFTESHLDGVVPASLTIRVISGLMLSFKRIATFVEVDMYGIFGDIDKKNHRTRSEGNNGMNPRYDQMHQPFQFRVTMPEMAYLRICVREERTNKLIGHCLLQVNQIRPGYRHIVLKNEIGQPLSATVFVFIEVKDYIPTYQIDLANALENPIRHQSEHDRKEKLEQLIILSEDLEDNAGMPAEDEASMVAVVSDTPKASSADLAEMAAVVQTNNSKPDLVQKMNTPPLCSSPAKTPVMRPVTSERPLPAVVSSVTPRRGSLGMENSEDAAVHQRFQSVHAPALDEVKNRMDSIRKLCQKQNKELQKLQAKYDKLIRRAEVVQTREMEKLVLNQAKNRALTDKQRTRQSLPALSSGSGRAQEVDEWGLEELLRQQEVQRWDLRRKHAEQLARLRKEHYKVEHDLNKRYHEAFYQMLEGEVRNQHEALNEQLKSVYNAIVSDVTKRISQENSRELRELKLKKELDKTQMEQLHHEVMQKYIKQGVSIRKNYETYYEDRKKLLTEEIEIILRRVQREKMHMAEDLDRKYEAACSKLDEEVRKNSIVGDSLTGSTGDRKRGA